MEVSELLTKYIEVNECAPEDRDASFDYCFNYFRAFHESGSATSLADTEHIEESCMQLGFYLASWGMYRGSTYLFGHSARSLKSIVECIANAPSAVWSLEPQNYTEESWTLLKPLTIDLYKSLGSKQNGEAQMSETLMTKILLGTLGCVPAFDFYVCRGLAKLNIPRTLNSRSLVKLGDLYRENSAVFEDRRRFTLNFVTDKFTTRSYPQARVLDMALFQAGCEA